MPTILDLCGGTGSWSAPYRELGYDVLVIDPLGEVADGIAADVRLWRPPAGLEVRGILAAPPCTAFSVSGARWWAGKGDAALLEGLSIVDACIRIIEAVRPAWWALENPVGRLRHYLGPARATFQPWQYGDPWQKLTCLWGTFTMPVPCELTRPAHTDTRIHRAPPGPGRARFRAMTPAGFARAFAAANP
jgi:hypothetical protein